MSIRSIASGAARWSVSRPRLIILAWGLFVLGCIGVGLAVEPNRTSPKDFFVGEAGRAEAAIDAADISLPVIERVLIRAKDRSASQSDIIEAAAQVDGRMKAHPAVASVDPPVFSPDRRAAMVAVTLRGDSKAARPHIAELLEVTAAVQAGRPHLEIIETGGPSISRGLQKLLGDDLKRAELITLPITLAILLFVFRSLVLTGVSLFVALSSIVASFGLYPLTTYLFPDAGGAVANVMVMIGMAVGVDYSLFYVKRVREERLAGAGLEEAIDRAAATSGRTVLVSGLAVLVALLGLYLADDVIFASVACGSIIVVVVSMVGAVSVLPALLSLSRRSLTPKSTSPAGDPAAKGPRFWIAIQAPALEHPRIVLVAALAGLSVLALPASHLKIGMEGVENYPRSIPAVEAYHRLTGVFPDQRNFHLVVVRARPDAAQQVESALVSVSQAMASGAPMPKVKLSADRRVSSIEIPLAYDTNSPEAAQSLRRLRDELLPEQFAGLVGASVYVSGNPARAADTISHQAGNLPYVAGFVLIATFIVVLAAFRSITIAVVGVLLNVLSAMAAMGALVLVFQVGVGASFTGVDPMGFIGSRIPLFLFVVLFGLSMDYQVFVVSRIREASLEGLTMRAAVLAGAGKSAGVVTGAAMIMVSVFASFMFVELVELRQIGFGLTFAVILDALVIRILVLPALLLLLGDGAWWPSLGAKRPQEAPVEARGS